MTLHKDRLYTPKEALDADPNWTAPVKLGRGRMPKGGDEHVRGLVAAGYRIKGYNAKAAEPSTSTAAPAEPVVTKAKANVNEVKDFTIFWPEASFKAVGVDKKEWGMREVCNTCRVSLVQNQCEHPTILGNIPVKIVPR